MRAPAFWWEKPGFAATLAMPAAAVYGAIAARRLNRSGGARAGLPVVCIGNPTLGGSGKTPVVMAIARLLREAGHNPAVLTRGYGGQLHGPVPVDPALHRARDVGDEPLLLARQTPTIVARDRVAGAKAAQVTGASVLLMDDGFQNPSLVKNLSILVVDGRRGVGNALVFPAGPLRAPLEPQLRRADAIIVVGEGSGASKLIETLQHRMPVWRADIAPPAASVSSLAGHRLLAFAGIGDPEKFFATLRASGLHVAHTMSFPDHHRFSSAEAKALMIAADREGLLLVTTEKDFVRLDDGGDIGALKRRAATLPVCIRFADAAAVGERVLAACTDSADRL